MENGGIPASSSCSSISTAEDGESEGQVSIKNVCSGVPNPLQNPVILSHMFQLCPVKLLANFRRVCKQWHDLALLPWRNNVPVVFRQDESVITISAGAPYTYTSGWMYFDSFLEKYVNNPENQTDMKPFRYMKLLRWRYDDTLERLRYFWSVLGNNVTTLELHVFCFHNHEDFQKIMYKCCPNLKHLILRRCWFNADVFPKLKNVNQILKYEEPACGEHLQVKSFTFTAVASVYFGDSRRHNNRRDVANLPVSWMELLTHFPSLTSLHHQVDRRKYLHNDLFELMEVERNCDRLLNSINIIREHDSRKLPLKTFSYLPFMELLPTHKNLALLRKLQLPIEKPALRFHMEVDTNEDNIKGILELYAETLHKLGIILKGSLCTMQWGFPYRFHLETLTSLRMSGVLCKDMGFLKATPNLTDLVIIHARNQDGVGPFIHTPTEMVTNTPVEELAEVKLLSLKSFMCDYILSEEDLRRLVEWMPNMEKLEMLLNDQQFEIVAEHWKHLRGLMVLGDELTDDGVTGWRFDGLGPGGEAVRPNITYLQSLIYCSFWSNLTDASVFQGFVQLPNLQRLQICPRPMLFSADAQTILRKRNIKLMGIQGDVEGDD